MGAARHQNHTVNTRSQLPQQTGDIERSRVVQLGGIEFQAAHHVDGFLAASQLKQSLRIGLGLCSNALEAREQFTEEETETPVTSEGAFGKPGIDQIIRNSAALKTPEEVGPDLRFDQNDHLGIDEADGPLDVLPTIDRVVDLGDVGRESFPQEAHAGRGRRRDNDLVQREQGFHDLDQLRAEVDLADTHRVEPNHLTVGQRLFEFGVIQTKTFAEPGLPRSAAVHLQKIPRSRQGEPDIEEDVVEKTHEELSRR